jgi:hypothetical protein
MSDLAEKLKAENRRYTLKDIKLIKITGGGIRQ